MKIGGAGPGGFLLDGCKFKIVIKEVLAEIVQFAYAMREANEVETERVLIAPWMRVVFGSQ